MEAVLALPCAGMFDTPYAIDSGPPPGVCSQHTLRLAQASQLVYQHGDCLKPNYLFRGFFYRDLVRMRRQVIDLGYRMTRSVDLGRQMSLPFLFWHHSKKPGPIFAMLMENHEEAILVFRGTVLNSTANWLNDLDLDLVSFKQNGRQTGRIHEGFDRALQCIWDEIEPWFDNLEKPLHITGHSLGGAMAVLAAARLYRRCDIASVTTFAQPRLGDRDFMDGMHAWLGNRYTCFIRNNDLVTVTPFHFLGYHHGRNMCLIDGSDLIFLDTRAPLWEDKLDQLVFARFLRGLAGTGIPHEELADPYRRLYDLLERQEGEGRGLSVVTMGLMKDWLDDIRLKLRDWQQSRHCSAFIAGTHDMRSYIADIGAQIKTETA